MGSKSIHELIPDIYKLVGGTHGISTLLASDIGTNIADAIQRSLGEQERRSLRLSALGPRCPKALWHSIHTPELAEPLPPYAKIKYCYGHIIEHLLIGLAKAAGHEVTGEQDELILDGVTGHRDCVIDGVVVDVKSSSTRGFAKFKDKTLAQSDDFGYLDQLDGYVVGSADDPLVRVKDRGYLLAIDKTLGHMALYEHRIRENSIRERIAYYKTIVARSEPPACTCGTDADGESGNVRLGLTASYSPYKHICFPGLRTVLYSSGPVYFKRIVKYPKNKFGPLPELTKTFH